MQLIKTEWFRRKKLTGWGVMPVTWQGWVCLIVLVVPLAVLGENITPGMNLKSWQFISFAAYLGFILFGSFALMIRIKVDERQRLHEAISDRNALWFLIFILCVGVIAESVAPEMVRNMGIINPFVMIGILGAWVVKVISGLYLNKMD